MCSGPPRIVHIITSLGRGGAEGMLLKLLRAMPKSQASNEVLFLGGDTALAPDIAALGIPLTNLGIVSMVGAIGSLFRIARVLRESDPDIVQSWLYHADLAATLAHRFVRSRASLVWNLRNTDMEFSHYAVTTRMAVSVLARYSHKPDLILSNSQASIDAHRALGYHPRRTEVVPNGFDLTQFRPDPGARARLRALVPLSPDALVVGMVARVDPMKDYGTLLAAAELIADERVFFVLIGRGTEAVAAAHRGPSSARIFGLGDRADVAALMPALDVFCLASAFGESFPNVLGEAMACALPCVTTDIGGAAAVVGSSGLVVLPNDPAALAAALRTLLEDSDLRARLGAQARRRVEQEFDIAAVAARYLDIYRGMRAEKCAAQQGAGQRQPDRSGAAPG